MAVERPDDGDAFAGQAIQLHDVALQDIDSVAIDEHVFGTFGDADSRAVGGAAIGELMFRTAMIISDDSGKTLC